MNLDKKKYNAKEVRKLLDEQEKEYERNLSEQKARITELTEDNKKVASELYFYKQKESAIASALTHSEEKAKEIEEAALASYNLTVESLKRFSEKWNGYFNELREKYPMYENVMQAVRLNEKLNSLFKTSNDKTVVENLEKELDAITEQKGKKPFNPQQKINEYIAATSDNGFNLEEVLNPGKLYLEDLCKELGLLEEKK